MNYAKIAVMPFVMGLFVSPTIAGKVCLFPHSKNVTSQDHHCSDNCGGHDSRAPSQSAKLRMPNEWVEKGAFFNNPKTNCNGPYCPWARIEAVQLTDVGKSISVQYRNWGRPITVNVTADICILD